MKRTLTIRIPDGLREDLQELSKTESKPVSHIVRESIFRYVALRKFKKPRNQILPFAEAQGILTDEDVFNSIS